MSSSTASWMTCLILTLLHSLWQSGLLYLLLKTERWAGSAANPLHRRNQAVLLLFFQWLLSLLTFFVLAYPLQVFSFSLPLISAPVAGWVHDHQLGLVLTYLIVAVGGPLLDLYGSIRLYRKCLSGSSWVEPTFRIYVQTQARQLGLTSIPRLRLGDRVTQPFTIGLFRPLIVIPSALLLQLSVRDTEMILLHELAHIRHRDLPIEWLLTFSESFFFFNPLIRLLCQDIRQERELACDAVVLEQFPQPSRYASALLTLARKPATSLSYTLPALGHSFHLLQRIERFSQPGFLAPRRRGSRGMAVFFLFLGIALMSLFLAHPTPSPVPSAFATPSPKAHSLPPTQLSARQTKTAMALPASRKSKPESRIPPAAGVSDVPHHPTGHFSLYGTDNPTPLPWHSVALEQSTGHEIWLFEEEPYRNRKMWRKYKMEWVGGQWQLTPLWMVTESVHVADSSMRMQ